LVSNLDLKTDSATFFVVTKSLLPWNCRGTT